MGMLDYYLLWYMSTYFKFTEFKSFSPVITSLTYHREMVLLPSLTLFLSTGLLHRNVPYLEE